VYAAGGNGCGRELARRTRAKLRLEVAEGAVGLERGEATLRLVIDLLGLGIELHHTEIRLDARSGRERNGHDDRNYRNGTHELHHGEAGTGAIMWAFLRHLDAFSLHVRSPLPKCDLLPGIRLSGIAKGAF
jgi:hypothetical protein